jgi:glycosyltransferase involved in cell wall biosynthesis
MRLSCPIIAGGTTAVGQGIAERLLPRAIESIWHVVGEIVVVDTGLSMKSRKFLDDLQARPDGPVVRLFVFEWCDDFSAARNFSLDLCTGDWILIVDTDEWLVIEDQEAWEALTDRADPRVDHYRNEVTVVRQYPDGEISNRLNGVRLFRRGNFNYHQPVHNQLQRIKGGDWLDAKDAPCFRVVTDGYALSEEEQADKWARHSRMVKAWRRREPRNHAPYHYLGKQYQRQGRFRASALLHERAILLAYEAKAAGNWNVGSIFGALDNWLKYIRTTFGRNIREVAENQMDAIQPYLRRMGKIVELGCQIIPDNPDFNLAATDYCIWINEPHLAANFAVAYLAGYRARVDNLAARGIEDNISLREDVAAIQIERLFEIYLKQAMGAWRELLALLPHLHPVQRDQLFGEAVELLRQIGWKDEAERARKLVFPLMTLSPSLDAKSMELKINVN